MLMDLKIFEDNIKNSPSIGKKLAKFFGRSKARSPDRHNGPINDHFFPRKSIQNILSPLAQSAEPHNGLYVPFRKRPHTWEYAGIKIQPVNCRKKDMFTSLNEQVALMAWPFLDFYLDVHVFYWYGNKWSGMGEPEKSAYVCVCVCLWDFYGCLFGFQTWDIRASHFLNEHLGFRHQNRNRCRLNWSASLLVRKKSTDLRIIKRAMAKKIAINSHNICLCKTSS